MNRKNIISLLVLIIASLSLFATIMGIQPGEGQSFIYRSIRGEDVLIYGKGIYKHMSVEVAPQGIAQDYVTLFIALPALIISTFYYRRNSARSLMFLTGVVGYFLVSYFFYLVMGMYNQLFLVYAAIAGCSFYAFLACMHQWKERSDEKIFTTEIPYRMAGGFLVFNAIAIAILWLGIIVPPLVDGSFIPKETEHYTTLIVQGLDLSILLPASFISGWLLYRKKPGGFVYAPVYLVFLSLLMTALSAKVVAMYMSGYHVIPVIFIIPVFNVMTIACMFSVWRNIQSHKVQKKIAGEAGRTGRCGKEDHSS